ncbi:hypothetical protein Tco_0874748 [Tanacetum coccineum]|uniref:Uncharacterized protein n=1 Tax=Tanacetum coccineum TaxID=301880 RepID=A0ABQ5BQB7_9ASTR
MLHTSSLKYALTINPTIYTSCIQHFWSTVKAKTVNEEVQLQALVDGKKIVVTEASVRRDLQLEDADGVDCLPNAIIFEQLTLMGVPSDPTNIADEAVTEEPSMQLQELMDFCTKLQQRVLNLENTKTAQAQEITSLKKRVKRSARVFSSEEASLGDQEDASKQGRKIDDIDIDAEITLVDESQGSDNDDLMFDRGVLNDEEVFAGHDMAKKEVSTADPVTTVGEVVTTNNVEVSTASPTAATITNVELTLAQTLAEFKSARPKTKEVVMHETSESITTKTPITSSKDKVIRLQAQFDEEERIAREKEEVNAALIAQWNDIQDKVETNFELAQRLQAEEQEELTIKEKSKLFQQLLKKRRKHFAAKRAEERRNRPPTKAQQRKLFDKAMKRVNTFVDMDTELVGGSEVREEGSETREESSSKRAGDELEQEPSKKQKMEDDKETAELQSMMEVIPDEEEVAVDAIPLATKPPSIVDWKIIKEGKIGYYQIIRADGNSKRYSSMIQMLKSFDREDLETLWKLVKAKHGYTRPEEGYERVLWGDLKTMFEHNIEDTVWRNLLGNKVLIWKLFDSCGVHFVRFQDMHIFMLVEKRYPLTPATITQMLNRKLQTDHCNEMCYQLLKLMIKQLKK